MKLICQLAGHKPAAKLIENDGYVFSRCFRCNLDLVKFHDRWSAAPRGFRIVWKPRLDRSVTFEERQAAQEVPFGPLAQQQHSSAPQAAEHAPDVIDRRQRVERRASTNAELPKFLNGRDRRRFQDRRASFGTKANLPARSSATGESLSLPKWLLTKVELNNVPIAG